MAMDQARHGERNDNTVHCVGMGLFIEVDLLVAREGICSPERLNSIACAWQMQGCRELLIAKPPVTNDTIFDDHN